MFATTNQQEPNAKPNEAAVPNILVIVRGCQATYENRGTLYALGLRWDPESKAWVGSIPIGAAQNLSFLKFPIEQKVEAPPAEEVKDEPRAVTVRGGSASYAAREALRALGLRWDGIQKVWKGQLSPARLKEMEALHLPWGFAGAPGPSVPNIRNIPVDTPRTFSFEDVTSGLPEGDRAEDEHRMKRHLSDLRARVKATRAIISADPEVARTLATNPEKAAAFYAIHGVTRAQVERGVPDVDVGVLEWDDLADMLRGHLLAEAVGVDWTGEETEREYATLPGSGEEA